MINGHNPPPAGNRSEFYAPHGVYPCIGFDEWCAIEVRAEEQWQAFVGAMGSPGWASDERFGTMQGRIANKEELDANISEWTRQYTPRVVMRILQQAGVPATYVANGETLYVDPHIAEPPCGHCCGRTRGCGRDGAPGHRHQPVGHTRQRGPTLPDKRPTKRLRLERGSGLVRRTAGGAGRARRAEVRGGASLRLYQPSIFDCLTVHP